MKAAAEAYELRTVPTILLGQEVGNMYTASLYGGLASLMAKYVRTHSLLYWILTIEAVCMASQSITE